jgi:hemerythrin superfamily protein
MDVRQQLRRDHQKALAELDAIAAEPDARRSQVRLARLRRAWMVHALAEETVVYRAVEGAPAHRADERFVEHELVENMFEKIARARHGTLEWQARINVVRELIYRHVQAEEGSLFADLDERHSAEELVEMGRNFVLARDKLAMLEEAKKAA